MMTVSPGETTGDSTRGDRMNRSENTRTVTRRLLNVAEAVDYQRDVYGRVAYGRAALYALAHSGSLHVIKNGKRKILFPIRTLDWLLGAGDL